jgi:predicted metal-dependent phosphoesterase TrpH
MASLDGRRCVVDLHTHTTASDGQVRPAELVALAAQRGIVVLGVTDHDTTAGLGEAIDAGQQLGVEVVPGIELSTAVEAGEVHVLGYFIDPQSALLRESLRWLKARRLERAREMVARLRRLGLGITFDDVRALAAGGTISRAHLARLLTERGYARSADDAFARFLARGRPAYVPYDRPTSVEAVRLVGAAGGAAVLAHPYSASDLDRLLPVLVAAGLAGIEVWYAEYTAGQRHALGELARAYELIPTGGSDYHGEEYREGRELGSVDVPLEVVEQLRRAAGLRAR